MFDSTDLLHNHKSIQLIQIINNMNQPTYSTAKTRKIDEEPYQTAQNQQFYLDNNQSLSTNHEEVIKSRAYFWNNVYYFHAEPFHSFFNNKQFDKSPQKASAQFAWAKFNPEKETNFEFDVFRMLKEEKETTHHSQLKMDMPQKQQPLSLPAQKKAILFEVNKPPPFMGAFTHVQAEFNFFNLNITLPTSQEYRPFACFYQEQEEQMEEKNEPSYLNVSKISAIQDIKKQNNHKYFFELESVQSQISQIVEQHKKEQLNTLKQQQKNQQNGEKSLLWNYSELFQERSEFKHCDPMWQQPAMQKQGKQSKIFEVKKEWSLQVLHEMECELNLTEEMKLIIPDEFILSQLSKLMQNVESDLFTLDYIKMEWSMDLGNLRLQHSFKSSLRHRIKDMLIIASYRSRIDAALQYIRKRPFRRVYYQIGVQITEILILFEEIVLNQAKCCNLVQFFSYIEKLRLQITILYKLLINQGQITDEGRSYEDFDYRYLNSQYVIFKQVVKQSKIADSLHIEIKPMINTLLCSIFKPITVILNNILFQECAVIELNQQIYLKYFFDCHQDVLEFVSRKIALIKGESHQLYQVCRMRDTIQILNDLTSLEKYQHRWERIFSRKRKLIERIRKNHKLKVKSERERKHEQRMKFIYSLKSRIYQQNQQENARKKQANLKNKEQLEKLKKQIEARQQRRKLLEQLQKEKEKGLILDIALQEKQRLQKEKQTLLKQMNELNGQNIETKAESSSNNEQKPDLNSGQIINSAQQLSIRDERLQNKTAQKQQQVKPSQVVSQQQIKSTNSIQINKMLFTADNFMLKKDRKSSKTSNNTQSYFRLANKHQRQSFDLDSLPSSDQSMQVEQLSQQWQQFEPLSVQLSINRQLDLNTSLQVCFSDIIKKQLQIIQSSLSFLIIDKYQLLSLLNFMRNVFMSGNGQRIQEFINVAVDQNSMLNLKYFSQCLLFDTSPENIQKLEPFFYHTKRQTKYNTEINIFQENIENYIGFQFRKLPAILQSYFAYTHISRYMQIFGFILRLRYSEKLINNSWKLLNNYKKELQEKQSYGQDVERWLNLLKRLYIVRYIISSFLITFQCYMFQKIIEKQFKIMKQNINNLHDLQANHLKMLDNIIRYTFVDNPNQNVAKNLRRNLAFIHEFYQIINQLTLDDIPTSQLKQTHERISMIQTHFRREKGWMQALIQKVI